jgi:hypothetical protein
MTLWLQERASDSDIVYGVLRFNGFGKALYPLQDKAIRGMLAEMGRQIGVVLYVLAMAAVIVGVDFAFFRNRFWERLTVNIGIVLVFAAFYLRFFSRP